MTEYARNVNDWHTVTITDDERTEWAATRPDLREVYEASSEGLDLRAWVEMHRDAVDAFIVSPFASWGEKGELQFNEMGRPVVVMATCGACGNSWNDELITSMTPVPSARCPFEYEHEDDEG